MRIAISFLLSSIAAFAQLNTNRLQVIPSATFNAVGEADFQSKTGSHYTGLAGADTIGANHVFRLPAADVSGGGCWNTDGSYNSSIGPCGANSTTVTPANPLLLYAHFRDDDAALYLDYSRDYLNYRPVSKGSLYNATNIRDPSVMFDGTTFWFLASPEGASACEPQMWSSTDLIHFTARVDINLGPYLSGCVSAVAPEWSNGNTSDPIGFWVAMGNGSSIFAAPYFVAFNPAINGVTPVSVTAVTVTGTTFQGLYGQMNIFDLYPYYDAGSNEYYLLYVDWNGIQYVAYAKSSTLLGTYVQQTGSTADHFKMSNESEAPAVVPLVNSTALYGIAGCVRDYADTWFLTWGAGPPASPNQGNRSYHWKYVDTCPSTLGGDPFAVVQPMTMIVNVGYGAPADQVNWVQGPMFSTLTIGQTLTIKGSNYTIATIPNPSALTLTTSPPELLNAPVVVPGIGTPVNISSGEQGTVILLTNQSSANIVYKAEDYWRVDPIQQSSLTIGGKGRGQFPLTVQSNYAYFGLGYDEAGQGSVGVVLSHAV